MKKTLAILGINILVIACCFAGIELLLRIFAIVPATLVRPVYHKDLLGDYPPNMHVKNEFPERYPHLFTTNGQGFRSLRELSTEPGAVNILCLGDSFTMGWGLDDPETYPEYLYDILSTTFPSTRFNVINAGRLFSNIIDQIDYYREKGFLLKPKIVIFQFYYNDVSEMAVAYNQARYARKVLGQGERQGHALLDMFRNTALYNFSANLKYKYVYNKELPREQLQGIPLNDDSDLDSWLVPRPTEEEKSVLSNWDQLLDEGKSQIIGRFWDNQRAALLRLKSEVEHNGGQFILLYIPSEHQLVKYRNGPNSVLHRLAGAYGLHLVDMTTTFRNLLFNDAKEFYLQADEHTNRRGNRLIAETLARQIRLDPDGGLGLDPPPPPKNFAQRFPLVVSCGRDAFALNDPEGIVASFEQRSDVRTQFGGQGCGLCFVGCPEGRDEASFELTFTMKTPLRALDIVSFRKIAHAMAGSSAIRLSVMADGQEYLAYDYRSDGSGRLDSDENVKMSEIVFPRPVGAFTVTCVLAGQAAFLTENNPDCSPDRRFEMYGYGP